jgi:hypothetical protein
MSHRPPGDTGTTSPYPTVVRVLGVHRSASTNPVSICYASAQEEWFWRWLYGSNLSTRSWVILNMHWGPLALGFLTAALTWNWNAWGKWHHREPNGSRHCLHVSTWQPWDQSSQIRIETKITNITNKTKSMSQLFNLNPNYPTYFLILLRSPPF